MLKRFYVWRVSLLVLILSFVFLSGCAKPPTQEMEQAEKSVAEAKQKEVDLYVPDLFGKVEASLKNAKDLVGAKKYKEAKAAAKEVAQLVQQAIPIVEQNKAKLKAEAEGMIQEVTKEIAEMKPILAKAIKKMKAEEQKEAQSMLGKWELDIVNIKDLLQGQKIKQAFDGIKPIKEQILALKDKTKAPAAPPGAGRANRRRRGIRDQTPKPRI